MHMATYGQTHIHKYTNMHKSLYIPTKGPLIPHPKILDQKIPNTAAQMLHPKVGRGGGGVGEVEGVSC